MKSFTLEIVTQEKHLLTDTINSLTVMTQTGEVTILADHIPLFSRLVPGVMTYKTNSATHTFAVSGGFIDVNPRNIVTVLADSAIRSDQINLEKAQQAIENAKKAMLESPDQKTTLQIELELRHATIQANLARKTQRK